MGAGGSAPWPPHFNHCEYLLKLVFQDIAAKNYEYIDSGFFTL